MPAISRVWLRSLSEYSTWPYQNGFAFSRGGADAVGYVPMRRRQRRMKANPSGPEGLALQGASAALHGLGVESTTPGAARLASAPLQSQRGSRGILGQAPRPLCLPHRALDALEHRIHIGVGVHGAQQPGAFVILDEGLGLRFVHLQALADDLFLVIRPLDQPMRLAAFLGVRGRPVLRGVHIEYPSAVLADSAAGQSL